MAQFLILMTKNLETASLHIVGIEKPSGPMSTLVMPRALLSISDDEKTGHALWSLNLKLFVFVNSL